MRPTGRVAWPVPGTIPIGQDAMEAVAHLRTLLGAVERLSEDSRVRHGCTNGPSRTAREDAIRALRLAGFVPSAMPAAGGPSFAEMMARALRRTGRQTGATLTVVRS